MDCTKCDGLMVLERVSDGFCCMEEWRCLNCGLVLDSVIAQNRLSQVRRRHRPAVEPVMAEAVAVSSGEGDTFTKTILLVEFISENCDSAEDGRAVNHLIEDLLNEGNTVQLDFHGVKLVSPSFYRAAVGSLSCRFPEKFLESNLSVVGLAEGMPRR